MDRVGFLIAHIRRLDNARYWLLRNGGADIGGIYDVDVEDGCGVLYLEELVVEDIEGQGSR